MIMSEYNTNLQYFLADNNSTTSNNKPFPPFHPSASAMSHQNNTGEFYNPTNTGYYWSNSIVSGGTSSSPNNFSAVLTSQNNSDSNNNNNLSGLYSYNSSNYSTSPNQNYQTVSSHNGTGTQDSQHQYTASSSVMPNSSTSTASSYNSLENNGAQAMDYNQTNQFNVPQPPQSYVGQQPLPQGKRYSVSYSMGSGFPVSYHNPNINMYTNDSYNNNNNNNNNNNASEVTHNNSSTNNNNGIYSQDDNSMSQLSYSYSQQLPGNGYLQSHNHNMTNSNVPNSYLMYNSTNPNTNSGGNYYHQTYGFNPQTGGTNSMRIKNEEFFSDLSPTVVGFPHHSSPNRAQHEDNIDEQPIPINYNKPQHDQPQQLHQPPQRPHQYQAAPSQQVNATEIFQVFQNRLKNSSHVKLLRTNTLPKEEISKNITIIEKNNKKVYFNFEYPTVSITFKEPINNITHNWNLTDKTVNHRKLVLFYWDFSLMKANHVINNMDSRSSCGNADGGNDGAAATAAAASFGADANSNSPEFLNENLEYIKSILSLKYDTITEDEYKHFFEKPAKRQQQANKAKYVHEIESSRLKHLQSIIQDSTTNTTKNTFCIISCLYWKQADNFFLTSVDLLFLLDKLSGRTTNIINSIQNNDVGSSTGSTSSTSSSASKRPGKYASKSEVKRLKQAAKLLKAADSKEVNRIRRNLLNFKSITLGKGEADYNDEDVSGSLAGGTNTSSQYGSEAEMDFFHIIMGFDNPKPRKIEKKLKVYEWSILEQALDKIMKKYCVDLKSHDSPQGGAAVPSAAGVVPATGVFTMSSLQGQQTDYNQSPYQFNGLGQVNQNLFG